MKKTILAALSATALFGLSACGETTQVDETTAVDQDAVEPIDVELPDTDLTADESDDPSPAVETE